MRPILIGSLLLASTISLFVACGQDTGSTSTSTSGSASGTGGAPNCDGAYFVYGDTDGGEPCDICLHKYCCASAAECRDKACVACVNYLQNSCGPKPRAVNDCLYVYCQPICSPGWPPTGATSTTTGG